MKYNIRIKILSCNFLGNILLVCSFIYLSLSIFHLNALGIVITSLFIILSFFIKEQSRYIIFLNKIFVLEKIKHTLNLLKLEVENNTSEFIIQKTKTTISVYNFFGATILSFDFFDKNSDNENYLATTLVKLQMQN